MSQVNATNWNTDDVYTGIKHDFEMNVVDFAATRVENFAEVNNNTDNTYMTVLQVPGEVSRDIALKNVANKLDNALSNSNLVNFNTNGGKQYNYAYTGSVSMQKVEDGSTSAWYVLVTVSIDATEAKK